MAQTKLSHSLGYRAQTVSLHESYRPNCLTAWDIQSQTKLSHSMVHGPYLPNCLTAWTMQSKLSLHGPRSPKSLNPWTIQTKPSHSMNHADLTVSLPVPYRLKCFVGHFLFDTSLRNLLGWKSAVCLRVQY